MMAVIIRHAAALGLPLCVPLCCVELVDDSITRITVTCDVTPDCSEAASWMKNALHITLQEEFGDVWRIPNLNIRFFVPPALHDHPHPVKMGAERWFSEQLVCVHRFMQHACIGAVHSGYNHVIEMYPWRHKGVMKEKMQIACSITATNCEDGIMDDVLIHGDLSLILPPPEEFLSEVMIDLLYDELNMDPNAATLLAVYEAVYRTARTTCASVATRQLYDALFDA